MKLNNQLTSGSYTLPGFVRTERLADTLYYKYLGCSRNMQGVGTIAI